MKHCEESQIVTQTREVQDSKRSWRKGYSTFSAVSEASVGGCAARLPVKRHACSVKKPMSV
eukprot:scaffold2591_cov177-Pinguiococcus_pyrenoidosus.AAC.2